MKEEGVASEGYEDREDKQQLTLEERDCHVQHLCMSLFHKVTVLFKIMLQFLNSVLLGFH